MPHVGLWFNESNIQFIRISFICLDIKTAIEIWLSFVTELSQSGFQSFATWLIQLFAGQDDELVCLLFSLLQLYQGLFSIKR